MLIAESGSTKTEWRLLEGGEETLAFRSLGINPNVLEPDAIEKIFRNTFGSHLASLDLGQVYFYGAGVSGPRQTGIIRGILQKILPGNTIYVEHDILAAARSTQRKEGIICILGTGSNSAHHKDHQITQIIGGLGYLFGDEGSGMDLGRHLIKGLLQDEFPQEVLQRMEAHMGHDLHETRSRIHHSSKPNVRMAELATLVGDLCDEPTVRAMVKRRFVAFLDNSVCRYPGYAELTVDFVGSISHFFAEILKDACEERQVNLGTIVKDPIDNLIAFHKQWQQA